MSISRFNRTRAGGIELTFSLLLWLLVWPQPSLADDERVTIPLALPFQSASSASSAAASASSGAQLTSLPQVQSAIQPSAANSAANPVSSAAPTKAQLNKVPAPDQSSAASSRTSVDNTAAAPTTTAAAPASRPAHRKIPLITTAQVRAARLPDGNPDAYINHYEDYVSTKIAPFVPGVAVVIVANGKVKSLRAFGVKKRGTRDMLTPDTVFRLASVSKTIASTAAAIMVEDGKLSWDTTVVSQLPEVQFKSPKYGDKITLKNILSQSSGLPTHTYTAYIENNMPYSEAVRRLRFVNFVCPPGKCYAYQNVVYSLAGDMISKQYGKPFEDYVEDKLFDPLGMRSASYGLDGYRDSPNRATPHIAQGKRWVPTDVTENYWHVPPAAGVNASIVDMSRFLLAQLGRRPDVLPEDALDALQARVTKNSPGQNHYGTRRGVDNTAYGLGWRVFDYGRYKNFVHHGGWVKGFRSEMVFNRDLGIGMVLLTNSETRLARNVIFQFMDYYAMAQDAAKQSGYKRTAANP